MNPSVPSFTTVVEEHWAAIHGLLSFLAGNTHDADELTQETFLRAFTHLDSFLPGKSMRAWLRCIAVNALRNVLRKRRLIAMHPLLHDVCGHGGTPEQVLLRAEERQWLAAAVEALPPTTRQIVQLRVRDELPFREIALRVGTNERTARFRMHQARKLLAERWERRQEGQARRQALRERATA
jgi:RNA polymerase sigma-70 factor (ECF subfamily)